MKRQELVLYFATVRRFLSMNLYFRYYWLIWALPLQIMDVAIGLFSWIYFAQMFGSQSPLLAPYGGDFISYLIAGLAVNGFMYYSMEAYYNAYLHLLGGSLGGHGQPLSMIDYVSLFGISPSAAMLGLVLDGYLEQGATTCLYLVAGTLLGLRFSPTANYALALVALLVGIIASSGIGLISASTVVLVHSWRGEEPIRWTFRVLSRIFSGLYFPITLIPAGLRPISALLPQTHVLQIVRLSLLEGASVSDVGSSFSILVSYALIAMVVGISMLSRSLETAKEKPVFE